MTDDVVLVDGVRTPIGRHGGALAAVRPEVLAATTITALLERTDLDPARLDDPAHGRVLSQVYPEDRPRDAVPSIFDDAY